jgi:hypothetical protein
MFYIKLSNNISKTIESANILNELYYNLAILDTNKYSPTELLNAKKEISRIDTNIPLFDIYSKNIYLITASNVYSRVIFHHYRLPNKKIIDILNSTLKKILKSKKKDFYLEKLQKNINFISNYDLNILEQTYYKVFYLSQPITYDLTTCIKPSFIPFITTKPYYTKSELINLVLNMNLKINHENINFDSDDICSIISSNEISAKEILLHQIYIQENIAKSYIQLYSLLGSYYWNFYIRNKCFKDLFVEKQIDNLYSIISKAPEFKKDYWLYRFISDDNYLSHLIPGDLFEERSFISTTRNPFYDPKNNLFGFILIKIKIPKGKEGIGLCIESYSMFQGEEEILLNPAILKLVSIKDNYHYYHPNPNASKRIKKLYEFELIESIKKKPSIMTSNYEIYPNPIPKILWLENILEGDDFASKVYYFYRVMLPTYNNKRYFYADIGNNTYLFQAFFLDDNPIYEKYFFLQKNENSPILKTKEEIYFVLQNENTGEINLFIELRDIISVNYINKFLGTKQIFSDEDFIKFISSIGHFFGIDQIIIHNNYESYNSISLNLLKDYTGEILEDSNPDNHIISLYSGDFKYYNSDLINFIEKKFSKFKEIPGITYNLKKHHIDFLSKNNAIDIFKTVEKTPLYNILNKLIKNNPDKTYKLLDFYIYIHYNYFYLLNELDQLIAFYNNDIFISPESNPWINSYFILKPEEYLYERKLIPSIKTFKTNIYQDYLQKLSIENKNITFNKYRLGLI